MPYTLNDSIKDEIELLKSMSECESTNFWKTIHLSMARSLERISQRMEGIDSRIATDPKNSEKYYIKRTKSNRKTLEEEYPSLRIAAERYDLIKTLVDSSPDE